MKRAAIIQSSYIPWKGYFDIINMVDEFVLYDDVQYSKNSWRNRNRIKTATGTAWITIPVVTKGLFGQPICEVRVTDGRWAEKHWQSLQTYYARARYFPELAPSLRLLYQQAAAESFLSRINESFIRALCQLLGIQTHISRSTEYPLPHDRVDRLVSLCQCLGAREYLTGPAAKSYLDEARFAAKGIAVRWMDYAGYPEYGQLFSPPFVHEVSVLDLLLNEGPLGARRYLLSTPEGGKHKVNEAEPASL